MMADELSTLLNDITPINVEAGVKHGVRPGEFLAEQGLP